MLPNPLIKTSWKLQAIGITDDCKNKTKDKLQKAVWVWVAKRVEFESKARHEVNLTSLDNCRDLPINKA
jgi:hypothetical protein